MPPSPPCCRRCMTKVRYLTRRPPERQRPGDEREQPEDVRSVDRDPMLRRKALAQRVERRGTDVAVDYAESRQRERGGLAGLNGLDRRRKQRGHLWWRSRRLDGASSGAAQVWASDTSPASNSTTGGRDVIEALRVDTTISSPPSPSGSPRDGGRSSPSLIHGARKVMTAASLSGREWPPEPRRAPGVPERRRGPTRPVNAQARRTGRASLRTTAALRRCTATAGGAPAVSHASASSSMRSTKRHHAAQRCGSA